MIKFEFEGCIHELRLGELGSVGIEYIDVLDEDEDGVQICGMVNDESELEAFKAFFIPHDDMIQNIYIEHQYKELFSEMDTSPCDDENFAISIGSDEDLESFLAIINK